MVLQWPLIRPLQREVSHIHGIDQSPVRRDTERFALFRPTMHKRFLPLQRIAIVTLVVTLSACGGGDEDTASTSTSGGGTQASTSVSSSSCNSMFPKYSGYKYVNDKETQCRTVAQGQESYRQQAIAACAAGDMTSANTSYSSGNKMASIVSFNCSL